MSCANTLNIMLQIEKCAYIANYKMSSMWKFLLVLYCVTRGAGGIGLQLCQVESVKPAL